MFVDYAAKKKRSDGVAHLAKILTTDRLLRYLASMSALHPIFFFIRYSLRLIKERLQLFERNFY